MWSADKDFIARGFSTPPPTWKSKRSSPLMPASEKKWSPQSKADLFHVLHKVPAGDSPYVRAKHVQLIDKDPSKAISLFWAAINSGDRVDSALKDMAVVMKQLDRSDEAIEAVKSFRYLCPPESQESLDNVLLELYKRSGRIEEQIEMLQVKLKQIEEGVAFGGRRTKTARSQGKKIQVTIEQEYSRLLGNLAWAYLQQENYKSAEELYRKALSIEPDKNKQCNLAICLMHMNRTTEAKFLLQTIRASSQDGHVDESYAKSFERAVKVLNDLESDSAVTPIAIEEESHLTSLSSFINRSSKGASTSVNGGQNHASNFGVSTRLRDGHEEPVLLDETNRRSRVQKQHKIYSNVVRFGKDNSEWTSLRLGNSSDSSSISSFVEKLKEWNPESQYKRTDFDSKGGKNKWFKSKTNGKQVGNSTGKKVYASLHFGREIPKVPFTQPRKSAWSNNGNPRALVDDNTVGGCSRKLSFDQSTASENVQSFTNQNLDRQLPASTDGLLEVAGQRSKTCSPSTNEDRRMLQGVHAEVNGESVLRPIVNGEWDMNYCAQKNGQMKLANIEIIPPMELAVSSGNHLTARETSTGGKWDQSFKTTIAGSVRLTERVKPVSEYMKTTQELQSQSEPTIEILEHPQEFFMSKSKKNWADMVEEDEQELLTGKFDFPENKWVYLSQDSTNSFRTPRKWSDNWDGSEFNDENMNSNIIHQTYSPADQIENISQKVESFNLEVGYYTQPQNDDVSLMNQPARRSLCFDQHQKHNRADNFCPSPLPNKTLDFEGHNALLTDDRECTSGNGVRLMRRNRLQVFQDITLFPESPRP